MARAGSKWCVGVAVFVVLATVGCSDEKKVTTSGFAAVGKPLSDAYVAVRGRNGLVREGKTGSDGRFKIKANGLKGPAMVTVVSPATGQHFQSIAYDNREVPVHPFTTMILKSYFHSQADGGGGLSSYNDQVRVPSQRQLFALSKPLLAVFGSWFAKQGVDPSSLDIMRASFALDGSGVDAVLDQLTLSETDTTVTAIVTDGTITQVVGMTPDSSEHVVWIQAATNDSQAASDESGGTINLRLYVGSSDEGDRIDDALAGVQRWANDLSSLVSSGPTAGALATLLDNDFLHAGRNASSYAAERAIQFQQVSTLAFLGVDRLESYDPVNKTVSAVVRFAKTEYGVTAIDPLLFSLKQQADGRWLQYGNQLAFELTITPTFRTVYTGSQVQSSAYADFGVHGALGTISAVTAAWVPESASDVSIAALAKTSETSFDHYVFTMDVNVAPRPGSGVTVTATTTSGVSSSKGYMHTSTKSRGKFVRYNGASRPANGLAFATVNPGSPLTVEFEVPRIMSVDQIEVYAAYTASAGSGTTVPQELGSSERTATLTVPSTYNGQSTTAATIVVRFYSPFGDVVEIQDVAQ